ncbi:MAG: DUF4876 domain-containing protein [Bacteroidales bacterium]|nr:DUF4876 domain-containing protein [Bacteroidales bacterium]
MKSLGNLLLFSAFLFLWSSCEESMGDLQQMFKRTQTTVELNLPPSLTNARLSDYDISFKNVTTGRITTLKNKMQDSLPEGLYDVSLEGNIVYQLDGKETQGEVKGYKSSVQILNEKTNIILDLFLHSDDADFVIEEIFFTGTVTPQGKQYLGDSYFKIYNNSDTVLYADGLTIVESAFLTTQKYEYTPNIMSQAMTVQAIYSVPGKGKDYPVEPGKSIIICDNAINHKIANPNSIDLSHADFEWYDVSTNPSHEDIDNPLVTNMNKIYCYTLTIWVPHNRGFKSYALARLNVDKETYLREYAYDYQYTMNLPQGTFPMSRRAYKIPNEWIIDAVNLSIESAFKWITVDSSLDMGWTYCGKIDKDKTRYGKSVRRKVLSETPDGRKILKDTNNSSVDFEAEAKPSLME